MQSRKFPYPQIFACNVDEHAKRTGIIGIRKRNLPAAGQRWNVSLAKLYQ
jgi:hypothetical protein